MAIKKVFIYLIVCASILTMAGSVTAVTINNPLGATNTFVKLLERIIDAVAKIIGSLAIVMFLVAGILFVTSAGSPERLGRAKTTLTYAVVGMAIALVAGGIVGLIKKVIGAG